MSEPCHSSAVELHGLLAARAISPEELLARLAAAGRTRLPCLGMIRVPDNSLTGELCQCKA